MEEGRVLQEGMGQMMQSLVGPVKELRFTLRVNLVCLAKWKMIYGSHHEHISVYYLSKSEGSLFPQSKFFLFYEKKINSYKRE